MWASRGDRLGTLAAFIRGLSYEDLPAEVIAQAKACLLDSLGCALGAVATAAGKVLIRSATRFENRGNSTIIGSKLGASLSDAVFTNAELVNVLDFDDTYLGHLGATVIPIGLGLGQAVAGSGKDLLISLVVGYEVGGRVGASLADGWGGAAVLGFGSWQVFGSAAAAARMLKLSEERIAQALALAGSNAPVASSRKTVLGQHGVSMSKNNFGSAARTGLTAALLAAEGFRGPLDILEEDSGFWRMVGVMRYAPERLLEGIGVRFVLPEVELKPYPVCRWLHPALDALQSVREQSGHLFNLDQVDEISIDCPTILTRWPYDNARPKNMYEAQFSFPFSAAACLVSPLPGPVWFDPEVMNHPTLTRLMNAVKLCSQPELDSFFPHDFRAKVRVRIAGRFFQASATLAKGAPQNPMSPDEVRGKFLRLANSVLPAEACLKVGDLIHHIEDMANIRDLAKLLAA